MTTAPSPPWQSRSGRPTGSDRQIHHQRNIVERCFNCLKGFGDVATAYDKTTTACESRGTLTSFPLRARSEPPGRRSEDGPQGTADNGKNGEHRT
ncbi:hypothetical protein CCS38_18035 [Streptomyces purpurogeneiscleroticus]|nr:hypothetical protein [Streptomyces purpurogeneiscleroticus]